MTDDEIIELAKEVGAQCVIVPAGFYFYNIKHLTDFLKLINEKESNKPK